MNGFATLGERFAGMSVWWALLLTLAVEGHIAAVWFRDGKVVWAVLLCSLRWAYHGRALASRHGAPWALPVRRI